MKQDENVGNGYTTNPPELRYDDLIDWDIRFSVPPPISSYTIRVRVIGERFTPTPSLRNLLRE